MAADGGYGAKIGFDPTAAASRTPGLHAGVRAPSSDCRNLSVSASNECRKISLSCARHALV